MNTYNPDALHQKQKKKKKGTNKGFLFFLALLVILLGFAIAGNADFQNLSGVMTSESEDYIGILEVHGTMESDDNDPSYNQEWLLTEIDKMMYDGGNKGLILSIDTPGGSVYTVDELYFKIKEYQTSTGRPVYAYMESMAASGGYYISAPADKIFANRNCWTGSIGVTIGTIYDISEFLEGMGITTTTITAGNNKAMGSATEKLTKEQKEIYQGLVDEAYEQFVGIVADGRKMTMKKVKKLADGRIYTALQAKKNGLIDQVGTREEALSDMKKRYELTDCVSKVLSYEPKFSLGSWLYGMTDALSKDTENEYDQVTRLMEEDNKFTISYMSQVKK